VANNLSIESPNFDRINKESGQFTSDAISLLWTALNDTRATERRDFRRVSERLAPKVLQVAAAASVDNLDSEGASTILFTSGTQNFTGIRTPETGEAAIVIVHNAGAGTITIKHNVTSETQNRFIAASGADVALATNQAMIFQYLSGNWKEIARSA
jgi:hypothetical protein